MAAKGGITARLRARRSKELPGRIDRVGARHPVMNRLILGTILAALLGAMMVDWTPRAGTVGLVEGEIAPTDVRAHRAFAVEDEQLTGERREAAREAVAPIFLHDVLLSPDVQRRIDRAFDEMRAFLAFQTPKPRRVEPGEEASPSEEAPESPDGLSGDQESDPTPAQLLIDPGAMMRQLEEFENTLGLEVRDTDAANLRSVGFSDAVRRDIKELVRVAMIGLVVDDVDDLPREGGIVVSRLEGTGQIEEPLADLTDVLDLSAARDLISNTAREDFADRAPHLLDTIVYFARELAEPNLRFNASTTEVQRDAASAAIQPVTTQYKRGQGILRAGEPITAEALRIIQAMNAGASSYHPLTHLFAVTLLLMILLGSVERFSVRYVPEFSRRYTDLLAMAVLVLLLGAMAALLHGLGTALGSVVPRIPANAYAYAVPVAAGAIMVRTLMNAVTSTVWAIVASFVVAAMCDGGLYLGLFFLVSSLAAAGGVGGAQERYRLIRAGIVAGLTNVLAVIAIDLTVGFGLQGADWVAGNWVTDSLYHVLFALGGGLFAGVLAVGLVPVFEALGFLTQSKLLELSNLNHPLLREMIVKAPGTYHHSMMVGSLAESAAKAVGADGLLVRVGAYFHDIGKTLKPHYFIENQRDMDNPHDRLAASMSALVITNHVKEGIELGRRYGLPEPIIAMIPQHHGTSLVQFFYNKALQTADPDKGEVDEADYRYPGPKPQTKEAAIMMLADGVEAATRSLKSHTAGTISARVQSMVNRVVGDGQLDECPLTLSDLRVVSETFVSVLLGIHHHRIEYPKPAAPPARGRGVPAKSITLELPNLTPAPGSVGKAPGRDKTPAPPDQLVITDKNHPAAKGTDGG
jgi:putative nucleotidyltransferase with HDIG domain